MAGESCYRSHLVYVVIPTVVIQESVKYFLVSVFLLTRLSLFLCN